MAASFRDSDHPVFNPQHLRFRKNLHSLRDLKHQHSNRNKHYILNCHRQHKMIFVKSVSNVFSTFVNNDV